MMLVNAHSSLGQLLMASMYREGQTGLIDAWSCQRWDLPKTEVKLKFGSFIEIDPPAPLTGMHIGGFPSVMQQTMEVLAAAKIHESKRRQTENVIRAGKDDKGLVTEGDLKPQRTL